MQLAGEIGFLSPGIGWASRGGRVHLDAFFGWVPEAIGGDDLFALTAKVRWAPWRLGAGRRWRVAPATFGAQLSHTFGERYYLRQPHRYPNGYYPWRTALHAGVSAGIAAARPLPRERELGVYAELVALDIMLRHWWQNPRTIGPEDVLSLALGVRYGF